MTARCAQPLCGGRQRLIPPTFVSAHLSKRSFATNAMPTRICRSFDRFSSEQGQESQRYKLERIQSLLGLRLGEMTQLLEVSPQGMRKWHAGGSMAPERSTRVDDLYNLAIWLASHIRPEALPAFMRRDIPALGGQTPLEWLRSRRWHELRRVYERIFSLETPR